MADQGYLEVKNWKQFQHYRDRDPQWIKLYRKVLSDYEFSRLQDASKLLLICIWLLASEDREHRGRVPNDPEWIARRAGLTGPIDLQPLVDAGFLMLARRKQDASKSPAKRLPRDRDRDRDRSSVESAVFLEAWTAYPKRPNNNRAEAWEAWSARLNQGEPEAAMLAGTRAYAAWVAATHTEPKYVKQAATFYGPKRHYLNDYEIPLEVIPGGQQDEERYAFLVGEAQRGMDMADTSRYPDWPQYRDRYKRGEKPRVSRGTVRSAS